MSADIKILIIQNNATLGNREKNLKKVENMVVPYEGEKFDIILLPEVWNVGWYCPDFPKMAETEENSQTLPFLANLAQKFNSNVIGGSYVRKLADGSLRNTMPVFNREGKLLAQYNKMHLFSNCGCNESSYIKNGEQPILVNLDVAQVGLSICYDIRFAEIYRASAYAGADILVNGAAWPKSRPHHWDTLTRARAIENQWFMIAVSQSGLIEGEEYNLGHSQVIAPFGEIISKMGNGDGCLPVKINLDEQRELRKNFPVLKDRHVEEDYKVKEV